MQADHDINNSGNSRNSEPADCDRLVAALPGSMRRLVPYVGLRSVVELMRTLGGRRIFVPRNSASASWLKTVLSAPLFDAIVAVYGGTNLEVPIIVSIERVLRNDAIVVDAAAGMRLDGLVDKYAMSYRHLRKIIRARALSA